VAVGGIMVKSSKEKKKTNPKKRQKNGKGGRGENRQKTERNKKAFSALTRSGARETPHKKNNIYKTCCC